MQAELEEEARKKKAREEINARVVNETKQLNDDKKKNQIRKINKPAKIKKPITNNSSQDLQSLAALPNEFRSNSPPVPALQKQNKNGDVTTPPKTSRISSPLQPPIKQTIPSDAAANYYVTESRLNLGSAVLYKSFIFLCILFCMI
jgi:hypothetical protein